MKLSFVVLMIGLYAGSAFADVKNYSCTVTSYIENSNGDAVVVPGTMDLEIIESASIYLGSTAFFNEEGTNSYHSEYGTRLILNFYQDGPARNLHIKLLNHRGLGANYFCVEQISILVHL